MKTKCFILAVTLCIASCGDGSAKQKDCEVSRIELTKKDTLLLFFKNHFVRSNNSSDIIFFYSKCIDEALNSDLIKKIVNKNIAGEECTPTDAIDKMDRYKLIQQIDSILANQKVITYQEFIKRFEKWKSDDKLMLVYAENVKSMNEKFFIEEILYDYPKTRTFFSPFLTNKTQYWGSLNPNDFCSIYFNVLKWLNTANVDERAKFFQNLYKQGAKALALKRR